ncbi:hypothetical protein BV20DRAFT_594547 [Pilatotrama ljubarskyi]|nr:hypothetical protein BV20DRAFT_594547 [Pilatotrama ljubarskyi]
MPTVGSTHRLAKRGVVLDPPLIAGIVVVAVLFNIILALSWCALRNRHGRMTQRRRVSAPLDCEKYENSVTIAAGPGAASATFPTKASADGGDECKSYFELLQALQQQPGWTSPMRQSRGSSRSSADGARLSTYVLRPQDITELEGVPRYPKAKGRVQALRRSAMLVSSDKAGLTRSNSLAETASVYSSASAPLDHHEQLLRTQPFALDPGPPAGASAWMSHLPEAPAPVVVSEVVRAAGEKRVARSSAAPRSSALPAVREATAGRRPSRPDVPSTPTISPTSTLSPQSPRFRARANSNPNAPPQVLWLPSRENNALPPSPAAPRRPSSVSSLSMILLLHEAARAPASREIPITPLNVLPRRKETEESTAMADDAPSTSSEWMAARAVPTLPVRSPRRPTPSGSVEHLP